MAARNLANNGSGNSFLPDSTYPLFEPMLIYHQRCSMVFIWEQFHRKCSWTSSITCFWWLHFNELMCFVLLWLYHQFLQIHVVLISFRITSLALLTSSWRTWVNWLIHNHDKTQKLHISWELLSWIRIINQIGNLQKKSTHLICTQSWVYLTHCGPLLNFPMKELCEYC